MSSGQGLLQDIIDHPGDDTLRRIYADWLDDDGQHDRAEFVRVQLDLAGMEEDDPRWFALRARERELLTLHEEDWLDEFWGDALTFHRGFPAAAQFDGFDFQRHGEAAFARFPIERVGFVVLGSDLIAQAVIDSPALDRVETLDLAGTELTAWNFVKMLQTRPLTRLRALLLNGLHQLGQIGLTPLLRHPVSLRLRELGLGYTNVRGNAVEELCSTPNLGALERLDLSGNELGAVDMQFLAGARYLTSLRHLDLGLNRIPAMAVRDLAQSPLRGGLEGLRLESNPFGAEGLEELSRSPFLTRLTSLELGFNQISVSSVAALTRAAFYPRLQRLSIVSEQLGAEGIAALLRGREVPALTSLDLADNDLGDDGAKALGTWPGLARLHALGLRHNRITAHGLRPLLRSPTLGPITALSVPVNPLGDMGAQVLARWPGLARIRHLDLAGCEVGDTGSRELLDAIEMIDTLDVSQNQLSDHLVTAFKEAEMAGRIVTLHISDQRPA